MSKGKKCVYLCEKERVITVQILGEKTEQPISLLEPSLNTLESNTFNKSYMKLGEKSKDDRHTFTYTQMFLNFTFFNFKLAPVFCGMLHGTDTYFWEIGYRR